MENKIKNPVSKKNIFFFNIFNRLIDSIENYVHKTEEDTFAENFDIVNEDSIISVSPKGSTVEKLALGDKSSSLSINDEDFIALVDVNGNDNWIELSTSSNNKLTDFILTNEAVSYTFSENDTNIAQIIFDKNGIAIGTNGTTYEIYEPQLSTIVNACEYSYDEDNSIYKLKMLPKLNDIDFLDISLEIDFGKAGDMNLQMLCNDEGLKFIANNNNSFTSSILFNDGMTLYSDKKSNNIIIKRSQISINNETNESDIKIFHENSSGTANADQVLKFIDNTNSLEVTFTVAELIALKAMLPTT